MRTLPSPVAAMDPDSCRFFNAWQHGFPLVARPFEALGQPFGLDSEQVCTLLRAGLEHGAISRVGAVFGVGSGGNGMLCAMQVPPDQIDTVAARINVEPGVNHNYTREHRLSLWFVVTAADRSALQTCVERIEASTSLPVLRLPMRRAYRIDLGFDMFGTNPHAACGRAADSLRNGRAGQHAPGPRRVDAGDVPPVQPGLRALAARLELGLQLVDRPYARLGEPLGLAEDVVIDILRQWCAQGTLRRLGLVLRHHEFGISANAMVVFALPAHEVDAAGGRLAEQAGVNLCYQRAPAPGWPYTLYCMVHGRERIAVQTLIEAATHGAGLCHAPREVLFSTRRHKQTGSRYFAQAVA